MIKVNMDECLMLESGASFQYFTSYNLFSAFMNRA